MPHLDNVPVGKQYFKIYEEDGKEVAYYPVGYTADNRMASLDNADDIRVIRVEAPRPDEIDISHEIFTDTGEKNNRWLPEERIRLVIFYLVTGSLRKACELTGIPYGTAQWWKQRSKWWAEVIRAVHRRRNEELDIQLTKLIHRGAEEIMDRIENGEEVLDKWGNKKRVKMKSRDLAVAALAVPFDKRALMRGDPTSRSESVSSAERLRQISEKLANIEDAFYVPDSVREVEKARREAIEGEIIAAPVSSGEAEEA